MVTATPFIRAAVPPGAFTEALDGLVVGQVTLEFTRRALAAALAADAAAATRLRTLLDDAWHSGRLDPDHYETLAADLGMPVTEDPPTEWSAGDVAPAADDPNATGEQRALRLMPGVVLAGRYELVERLDSAGMCDVFRALDRGRLAAGAGDARVALKVVGPHTRHATEALQLLEHEAALAARVDHPNVAGVLGFLRDGDFALLALEWLEGESLGERLTRERYRPLGLGTARRILDDVGAALAAAHARGIVHADVKPGNVFVTRDGHARLLDFGLAREAGSGPAPARTPAYASCEVLEGAAPLPADDVYSLACVAYRMLAGRRAFGHHDALAAEQTGRRPGRIRTLGDAQWAALERALAFRRAARTADVATFLAEFGRAPSLAPGLVAREAPLAVASSPAVQVAADAVDAVDAPAGRTTPTRRRPVLAGLAAAAAMAVVAVLVLEPMEQEPAPGVAAPASAPSGAATDAASDPAAAAPGTPAAVAPTASGVVERRSAPAPAPAAPSQDYPARADARPPPATGVEAAAPATPAPAREPAPAAPVAAAPLAPAGPRQVALTELEFRRYVEPRVRSRATDRDGWVEVAFLVDGDGVPRDIAIVDSSPAGRYDAAARAAVEKWRFDPPVEDGRRVARRTGVRLRFEAE